MVPLSFSNLWKLKNKLKKKKKQNNLQRDPDFNGTLKWMSLGFVVWGLSFFLDELAPSMVRNLSNQDRESVLNCFPDFLNAADKLIVLYLDGD